MSESPDDADEKAKEEKKRSRSIYQKQMNPITGTTVKPLDDYLLDKAAKYPRDHVHKMDSKAFGIQQRISHRAMLLYYLAACGVSYDKIAEQQGMPREKIKLMLNRPNAKECIDKIRWKLFGQSVKKRIEQIVPEAVETAYGIMTNENFKESTRLEAAKDFMDRGLGRAVQTIEVEGNLVKELLMKLDGNNEGRKKDDEDDIIDAVFRDAENVTDVKADADDVDSWAAANLDNIDKLMEEDSVDGKNSDS